MQRPERGIVSWRLPTHPLEDGAAASLEGDALATWIEDEGGPLTLLGVVAIMDPPRTEAAEAVAKCKQAGVRVMMITGDHARTAQSIGARLGLAMERVHSKGTRLKPPMTSRCARRSPTMT
jgi:magnesium-transporting ATPase (P-type)